MDGKCLLSLVVVPSAFAMAASFRWRRVWCLVSCHKTQSCCTDNTTRFEDSWDMQYAFRGHLVAIINENTASDGEALAYGLQARDGMAAMGSPFWVSSSPLECNFEILVAGRCPHVLEPLTTSYSMLLACVYSLSTWRLWSGGELGAAKFGSPSTTGIACRGGVVRVRWSFGDKFILAHLWHIFTGVDWSTTATSPPPSPAPLAFPRMTGSWRTLVRKVGVGLSCGVWRCVAVC